MPRKAQPVPKRTKPAVDNLVDLAADMMMSKRTDDRIKKSGSTWGIYGVMESEGKQIIRGPFDSVDDAARDDMIANAQQATLVRARFSVSTTLAVYRSGEDSA